MNDKTDSDTTISGTTQIAGQSHDMSKGRIFPCEACGADLEFHIGNQSLKCPFCGHIKQIKKAEDKAVAEQAFHAMLAKVQAWKEQGRHEQIDAREVRCNACGANVVFLGTLTSSSCSYCGSSIQLDDVHQAEQRIPVDGMMPFLITYHITQENLRNWVQSLWFAPDQFKKQGAQGQFEGVYLPFWTFDSLTFTCYSGQRGENYTTTVGTGKNKRTVTKTRWYPASGEFERFFDDVLVLAVRGLSSKRMQKLEPWPLHHCVPFNQELMAGITARTYEIELDEGFEKGKSRIDQALLADVRVRIGGDQQRVHAVDTTYNAITFKHLLLPVWLMVYRFRDKPYQVMINATTGEVQGERPYSWWKIALTALLAAGLVGGLVYLFQNQA